MGPCDGICCSCGSHGPTVATDGAIMASLDFPADQVAAATAPQPGQVIDELARRRRHHREHGWLLLAAAGVALYFLTRGGA
jgi:hypothetical protein